MVQLHDFPNTLTQGTSASEIQNQITVFEDSKWIIEREGIRAFANYTQCRQRGLGVFPRPGSPAQCWYSDLPGQLDLVFVAQDVDGNFLTVPNDPSDEGLQWVSRDLGDHYRRYPRLIPRIPKFVKRTLSPAILQRPNWKDGPGAAYPICQVTYPPDTTASFRSTLVPGLGFQVNPGNPKQLQWYKIAEWEADFPSDGPAEESFEAVIAKVGQLKAIVNSPLDAFSIWESVKQLVK